MGEREVRTDAAGRPVISFVRGTRDGRPWADLVEVLGPGAADLVARQLPGWIVSAPEELGFDLVARGARARRHAHCFTFDLGTPPPAAWADPELAAGLRATPFDRKAADLAPMWQAAYPPAHPDHNPGPVERIEAEEIQPLLDGTVLGPLLPCSGLVVDEAAPGTDPTQAPPVVAAILVCAQPSAPPLGGPWIAEVFRDPAPRYAGLGAALIRRALALAAADGLPAVGLAVTEANPARQVYERIGFRRTLSALTVLVPG